MQQQVKRRLRCSLKGEPVQIRATGLRQELIKSRHDEIRYVYCRTYFKNKDHLYVLKNKLSVSWCNLHRSMLGDMAHS